MKTKALENYGGSVGVEAYDIDWNNPEEVLELGRLAADQCIVFVNEKISTQQLYDTMSKWGRDSRALIHNYILSKRISGRHWRELTFNLGLVNRGFGDFQGAATRVSYVKDDKGRYTGLFANGELDWHCDQVSIDDAPRMIGLQSLSDTENSQTQFLCTFDAWETLSSDLQSAAKELYVKHEWREGPTGPVPGLDHIQAMIAQYNNVPLDGLETRFYSESATGRPGLKIQPTSFNGFVGMSLEESKKLYAEYVKAVFQEKYVYTQNWVDGQLVLMDQEITQHKRPTNVQDGDKRTMARVVTHLDYLYPTTKFSEFVRFEGKSISHDEFAKLVDADCKRRFEEYEALMA
jgi:alpha-ketoglutarate-dependent taurine dioxygenase